MEGHAAGDNLLQVTGEKGITDMEILADFHVHSNNSHDGVEPMEKLALAAVKRGISAICITDHNVCTLREPEVLHGVLFVPGCEVSTTRGHMTALFIKEALDLKTLRRNGLPEPSQAASEIRRCGGIAVMAHPFYKPGMNLDDIAPCLDGAETANSRAYYKNPDADMQALEFAEKFGLLKLGGSDAHTAGEVGNSYICLECRELTAEDLRQAVTSGKGRVVSVRKTPRRFKGVSQLYRAARTKKPGRLAVGAAYMAYCVLYDIFKRGGR